MDKAVKAMREAGLAQARLMRDKARASAMKRKEEYLGARVPKELRAKVIAKASELGIPVSILIRNILEQAFSGEGGYIKPATAQAETAAAPGGQKMTQTFPAVIGWEQITLNRDMQCSSCGVTLSTGSVVTLGLAAPGEDHVILCGKCNKAND